MNTLIRTFIAIKLPKNIISSMEKVMEGLKPPALKVKWVLPENIHLTLKFLGNIDAGEINTIDEAIKNGVAGFSPIHLFVKGGGVFPDMRRPRVIWAGVAGETDELIRLQESIDTNLTKIGFSKDRRFKSHLTVGRVKGSIDPASLVDFIMSFGTFESKPFIVDKIFLIQSDLKPDGPIYTNLISIKLTDVLCS